MRNRKIDTGKAGENVVDYRHRKSKRLNIPPAGLEARGEIAREKRVKWAYNPHLAPALRFDGASRADDISELIAAAGKRKPKAEELPLTAAQQTELDRRLEACRLNPEKGSTWKYVKRRIREGK